MPSKWPRLAAFTCSYARRALGTARPTPKMSGCQPRETNSMYSDDFGEDSFEDFPSLPWAEDPIGYWHFKPDTQCVARFASGLTWKEPGDLLHVEVAGELNARWGGAVGESGWRSPPFVSAESLAFASSPLPGGPDGLFTSRGILSVTRIEADGGADGKGASLTRPWTIAALVHGDGHDLYQAVSIITRNGPDGGRVPLTLDGDAVLELWADAGVIGVEAFRSALDI